MSDTPRTDKLKNAYCDMPYMDEAKALTILCHELELENARLLANESAMKDQICEMAAQLSKLRETAQSVVDRWETPLWKDVEPTAACIYRLRDSLPNAH
jgi:hypothetical protein